MVALTPVVRTSCLPGCVQAGSPHQIEHSNFHTEANKENKESEPQRIIYFASLCSLRFLL